MKNNNFYQHGDLILNKINGIPDGIKKINESEYILAHGESGHKHAILETEKAEYFENKGVFYLKVNEPVDLTHEEHKSITINPGYYEIDRVKEYDPFEKEIRRVQD